MPLVVLAAFVFSDDFLAFADFAALVDFLLFLACSLALALARLAFSCSFLRASRAFSSAFSLRRCSLALRLSVGLLTSILSSS